MILQSIAQIKSGYSFRTKVHHDPSGDVSVIQMKDVSNDFSGLDDSMHKVKIENVSESHLLQKGDILMMAKGNNNKCFVYDSEEEAVAVSLFFVIRSISKIVNPYYLSWFLNLPHTQSKLASMRAGGLIGNLVKADLESIEIVLPEIEKQTVIAEVNKLSLREQSLTNEIKALRKQLVQQKMINVL